MDIAGKKLIIKALMEEKVDTVFAYPGGMIVDIMDELYKQEKLHVVLARHEQALVHEAEGYARATGKPGVCLVTSGPGATNTITAIADAHYDSVPLVVLTGQVPQGLIGNDAFQEVDIVGMTRSVTKYSVTVRDRKELGRILKMAFEIATTGKPGPVIIDIPKDIQTMDGPAEYPGSVTIRGYQLKRAFKLLSSAKQPMILAGGGVKISGAEKELLAFAESMQIPVVTTIMGKGTMPEDHKLYVGNSGMHGRYAANMAVMECDVLFSIGTRFNDRITGDLNEFAPKAKIIHVDVETASISRNVVVDIPVVSDAKLALQKLSEWAKPMHTAEWLKKIDAWEKKNPLSMREGKGVCPQKVMEAINEVFPKSIVVTDVGQHQMWATQYIKTGKDSKFITSGGLGTMGFGFPAAVGAAIGAPKKDVVCITGDGGFQMVCQGAEVVICVMNNQYLGMVRQMQQLFYGKRYSMVSLRKQHGFKDAGKDVTSVIGEYVPDFVKLADVYDIKGIRVESNDEILPALKEAKKVKGKPTIVEFMIPPEELVLPMVKGGNPMSEMILK